MLEKERKYAIIVAGGTGKRMEAGTPKQFLVLAGKPMVMHAMEAFYRHDKKISIILVLPRHLSTQTSDHPITRSPEHLNAQTPEHFPAWHSLCRQYGFSVPHEVVAGGDERYHSVGHGLKLLEGEGLVAIHDAARPAVSLDLISRSFQMAGIHGAAVPVIPVQETIRQINREHSTYVDRKDLFLVQTPQIFSLPLIREAYRQKYNPSFTDDAAVVEAMGRRVHYFEGEKTNIKVTFPEDLKIAEKCMTL